MSDDDDRNRPATFQEIGETWGTKEDFLGNGVAVPPALPKTCAACGKPLPMLRCLRCGACQAIMCRGPDDRPWGCFIRHCAQLGENETHRGKEATVFDFVSEIRELPT